MTASSQETEAKEGAARPTKQVIVINRGTVPQMRRGKQIAQGAHASLAFLTRRLEWIDTWGTARVNVTPAEYDWPASSFRKIVCQV